MNTKRKATEPSILLLWPQSFARCVADKRSKEIKIGEYYFTPAEARLLAKWLRAASKFIEPKDNK